MAGMMLMLAILSGGLSTAFADKFNTESSSSAQAFGMGGAGVNTERGPAAVFYNPANIAAKDTRTHIQLLNFQADFSEGWVSRAGDGAYSNFQDLSGLYDDLKSNKNTYAGGRFSLFPNFTIRNFSLGLLYEVNQGAQVNADDSLRVKARNRFGPVAALSFRLFGGVLRLGGSAQLLTRGDADSTISPPINQGSLDFGRSINAGTGLVKTGGVTLTVPVRYLPSFSLVARDIGGTTYSAARMVRWGEGTNLPTQEMTIDFGSSVTVYLGKRAEVKLAYDHRDLGNKLRGSSFRHSFFGAELVLFDLVKFRTGMGHGYMSYGLGIETKKASLDIAAYADEKDDRLRASREQRYVLQYTWNLGGDLFR